METFFFFFASALADSAKAVNNEVGKYPMSKYERWGVEYSRMEISVRDHWRLARAHLSAIRPAYKMEKSCC